MSDEVIKKISEIKEQKSITSDLSPEKEDLTDLQAKVETTNLKKEIKNDKVEVDSDWSYELMKDSVMHTKLLTILGSENKVEKFAEDIDKIVRKFLDQELEGFSNSIKNSMSVGIQFAMMETLIEQGAEGSTDFFTTFSSTKLGSPTKSFEGLYKSFSLLGSTNNFFILANKVQNISWYLSDKKSLITASKDIPELMNPVKFKTLLNKPVWSTQSQIDKLDITTIFSLDTSVGVELSDAEKTELKKIVDNTDMPITEKTISAIQKSLKTADKLLDTRKKVKTKASEWVDKIASVLDINIPFLGNLGEMIGMKFPTDILGEQKDGGVLNFVLGMFGFRGGVKGLHKEYIKEKLDDLAIDNTFITTTYTDFQKNTDTTITNDSETSTWKTCLLTAPDTTTEIANKAKIPADYAGLKKSIVDNLSIATLNPIMVAKFAPEAVITENKKSIVDMTKILGKKDSFVDTYLKYIIPLLADSTDDFITSKNIDKDSFALAVMGGLVGDKYFIEGVNIGLLSTTDFKTTGSLISPETTKDVVYEDIDESDPELIRLSSGPNESYSDNTKFVQYLHVLEKKNGLTYGVMLNLMKQESGGMLYTTTGAIIGSSAGARGLFQFTPDTAKIYIKKLGYTETEYEKIYTNPIVGAKACALFLKDRIDAGDNTINMLAHYNAGPGVLSSANITPGNFSGLPTETQKYIVTIGTALLKYSNKDVILTTIEKSDPKSISKTVLEKFFTAVNTIPAYDVKIEAKTIDQVVLVGDSHAGGIKSMGGFIGKTFYYDGYDSGQLFNKIKTEKFKFPTTIKSLILVVGINDITKGLVSKMKDNLEKIKTEIQPIQLVLCTLPYSKVKTVMADAKVDEVNTIIKTFAKDNTLPVIDVHSEVTLKTTEYQVDGGHLTNSGYAKIAKNITSHITGIATIINVA